MKYTYLFLCASLIIATLPAKSFAAEKTCQSLKRIQSTTSVWLSVPEPSLDNTLSRTELNKGMDEHHKQWLKDNGLELAVKADSMSTEGLHTAGWAVNLNNSGIIVRDFDRQATPRLSCVYFKNLDVTVYLRSLVSIISEYPRGGCSYNHVLKHEMKHYETHEAIIRDAKKKLQDELPRILAEVEAESKPIIIADEKKEAQRLFKIVSEKIIKYLQGNTQAELKKQNALIDSPEEYTSVSKLVDECGN